MKKELLINKAVKGEYPLFTDLITFTKNKKFDEKFEIFLVKDEGNEKGNWEKRKFTNNVLYPLAENPNVRSVLSFRKDYDLNCRGAFILINKGTNSGELKEFVEKQNEENGKTIASIQQMSSDELKDAQLLQLMINGVHYLNDERFQYSNELFSLITLNEISRNKENKQIIALKFNSFSVKDIPNLGLAIVDNVVTYRPSSDDSSKTKYYLDGRKLTRWFKGTKKSIDQKKTTFFEKRGFEKSKNIIPFCTFKPSSASYQKVKINALFNLFHSFKEAYSDVATLEQRVVDDATFVESNLSVNNVNELSEYMIHKTIPNFYIDYDTSIKDLKPKAEELKEQIIEQFGYLGYTTNDVIVEKGPCKQKEQPVVKIICAPEDYQDSNANDAYNDVSKEQLNVQHIIESNITFKKANEKEKDKKKSSGKEAIRSTLTSLSIQMGVSKGDCDYFGNLKELEGFIFFVPQYEEIDDDEENKEKSKKTTRKKYRLVSVYFLKVLPEGKLEIFTYNATELKVKLLEVYLLLSQSNNEDEETGEKFRRFTYGIIPPGKKPLLSQPTEIGTSIPLEEFDSKHTEISKIKKETGRLPAGTGFRSEEVRKTTLRSVTDAAYFEKNDALYYFCAGGRSKGIKENLKRRPLIHRIDKNNLTEEEIFLLMKSMGTPYSKSGELSIVPYPVKILRTLM